MSTFQVTIHDLRGGAKPIVHLVEARWIGAAAEPIWDTLPWPHHHYTISVELAPQSAVPGTDPQERIAGMDGKV